MVCIATRLAGWNFQIADWFTFLPRPRYHTSRYALYNAISRRYLLTSLHALLPVPDLTGYITEGGPS